MKLGTKGWLRRGSHGLTTRGPGRGRWVRVVLVGARGQQVRCRLIDNDPGAAGNWCTRAGDIGWWSKSCFATSAKEAWEKEIAWKC